MRYMVALIRSLQIILHLPLLQILVPGNVIMFFSAIIPIAMFDVLESEELSPRKVFNFMPEEVNGEDIFDQMRDLGYETHSSVLNLGTLFVLLIVYFIQVFYCGLLGLFVVISGKGRNHFNNMKKQLFFNGFFSIILEAYIEFLISSLLNLSSPESSNNGELISKYLSYFCLFVTLIICPIAFAYVLKQPLDTLNSHAFESRWGSLYESVKLENKYTTSYYLVFMLRRIVFVGVAFFMYSSPSSQLQLIMFLNTAIMIYFGSFRPLDSALLNRIEMFNEQCISIVTFNMMLFTSWVDNPEARYMYGWTMNGVIIICLIVNLFMVLYFGFKKIKLVCIKYGRRIKRKWNKLFPSEVEKYWVPNDDPAPVLEVNNKIKTFNKPKTIPI